MSAGAVLQAAAVAALGAIDGMAAYDGAPVQAALPFALVEVGPESDWGHKSGAGRELRLAVTIRDKSERPERLRRLMDEAEAAVAGLPAALGGWRVVTLALLRTRVMAPRAGEAWAGVIEFRARMLAE